MKLRPFLVAGAPTAAYFAATSAAIAVEAVQSSVQGNIFGHHHLFAPHHVVVGLIVLGVLVAAFCVWNWSLRRGIASATEALGESEDRYRTLIELSPEAIFVRCEDRYVFANKAAVKLLGAKTADELLVRSPDEILHPDSLVSVTERRAKIADGQQTESFKEHRYVRLDGRVVNVETASSPFRWYGKPAILIVSRDIEMRKNAEAALRENEERLAALLNNSPTAIFLKDLQGRYLMVNKRFEEWYGKTNDELIGRTSEAVFTPELRKPQHDHDRQVLNTMSTVEQERITRFGDCTDHRVLVTKFPIMDGDGKAIGIGGINIDVTEQRNAEAQLHQAQKMEAVGRLTGGIAHEFNNLLLVIMGNVELLEDKLSDDGALQKLATTAKKSALRGAGLTRQILAFSRSQTLEIQRIELGELTSEMFEMLRRTLGETIIIDVDVADEIWDALADKGQTEGALLNLAINARDAMPDGGRITIRARNHTMTSRDAERLDAPAGDYVALSVIDTGVGMAPHVVDHAFDPFFTTKPVGRGTGLGLSIVYGFVKQCGGSVEIDSEPDHGTGITLYLPRAGSGPDEISEHDAKSDERPMESTRILVVDDDPDVRNLAVSQLRGLGYQVEDAVNANNALVKLSDDGSFDLLFTDVVMPGGMSGLELWRHAEPLQPGLKVIFTSGYSDDVISATESLASNFPFVRKPYVRDDLARVVSKTLLRGPN